MENCMEIRKEQVSLNRSKCFQKREKFHNEMNSLKIQIPSYTQNISLKFL